MCIPILRMAGNKLCRYLLSIIQQNKRGHTNRHTNRHTDTQADAHTFNQGLRLGPPPNDNQLKMVLTHQSH